MMTSKPPLRILHLEDNRADAELVRETLAEDQLAGEVVRVESRAEFAAALAAAQWDAIFADFHCPSFDGMAALALAHEQCPEVPFIFVSGVVGEGVASLALTQGATDSVLKDDLPQLGTRLRRALQEVDDRRHRGRAEAALRASETRYRIVSELTTDYAYSFRIEADGSLTNEWVTEAFARAVGLSLEEMRVRGGWSRFICPDDQPIIDRHLQRIMSVESDAAEFRFVTAAGEVRWVHNCARAVWDETHSRIVRIVGAAQDITDRKNAEAALRTSEAKFRVMAESTSAAVLLYGSDRITYVNPATVAITGFSRDELLGMTLWDLIHPDFHEHVRARRRARERGEPVAARSELQFISKSGAARWVDYTAGFLPVDGATVGIGTAFDITERKQAEEALHNAQRRLEEAQARAQLGSWEIDPVLERGYWSAEMYRIYDRDPALGVPSFAEFFELVHPEDRGIIRRAYTQTLETGQSPTVDFRTDPQRGAVRYLSGTFESVRDAEGKVVRLAGTVQDITERTLADRTIRENDAGRIRELLALSHSLSASLPIAERLRDLCRRTVEVLGCDRSSIFIRDGNHYRARYNFGNPPDIAQQFPNFRVRLADPLISQAMATRAAVVINDAHHAPLFDHRTARTARIGAIIVAPLLDAADEPLGFMTAEYNETPGAFAELPASLVFGLAKVAEMAILADRREEERRRDEAALRESEERLRLALDAGHTGTFDWDLPHNHVTWSRWHEELWGFKPGEFGGTFGAFSQRVHSEDLPGANAEAARCIAAREPFAREFRVVWPDGSVHWVMARGEFTFDEQGQAVRMRGAVVETTARKEAEEALRNSEAKFSTLFERAPFAIVLSRLPEGIVVEANEAFEKMLGYSKREATGKTSIELGIFPDEGRERMIAEVQARGSVRDLELTVRAKSGERRVMLINSDAVEIGGGHYALTTAQDISERKLAEVARRESEERYRTLFESAPDGILIADSESYCLDANASMCRMLGYTRDELIGLQASDAVAEAEIQNIGPALSVIKAGSDYHQEWQFRRKDGSLFAVETIATMMPDGNLLMMVRDITERKQAEAGRVRLQAELRRSEVMAAMGSLVSGVAHEVRNPLFGMGATLDAFAARFGDRQEYRRYLKVLRSELERLNELMRDLLEYGKPSQLEVAPVPLTAVIADAVSTCRPLAEQAGVCVSVRCDAGLTPISMDRRRMQQAFQNLIDNAIQHSPHGVAVVISATRVQHNGGAWVECAIEDAGPGFRTDDLPRAFEPFFTRRRGGTGLGLSIVQRIVEAHGGMVTAANRPGGGAVLTVRLPAI